MENHHPFDVSNRLTSEELSKLDVALWQPPTISNSGHLVFAEPRAGASAKTDSSSNESEEAKKEAYKAGFEEGKSEGLLVGKKEGLELGKQEGIAISKKEQQPKLQELNQLLTSLSHALNEEDYKLEKSLFDLVKVIAEEVIRKEVELDPASLMKVVKEVISSLPPSRDNIKICLNPLDKPLADEAIAEGGENWHVTTDEEISRGGCLVSTDQSEADGTLEQRLKATLDQLYENQAICPKPGEPGYEEAPSPAINSEISSEVSTELVPDAQNQESEE